MQDSKSDVRFIGFNKYTRVPVRENTAQNWVQNGRDNANYKYIIERNNGSTTNKAINNAYTDLAYGRGLSIHDVDDDSNETKELLKLINKKDLKAILADNQVFSAHSIVIHRQKGNKNKLARLDHIEKSNVIPSIKNEDDGLIHSYFYSEDWTKTSQTEYIPKEYPAFGFGQEFGFKLPEIYVGKPYQIGQIYFEQPDYDACLQYAQIEEELSNYYISHILNGLSFGSIVNVPNSKSWSEAQKQEFMDATRNKLGGSSSAGKQAFNFKAGESEDTTITNVENNTAHKQWEFLGLEASSKILSGHKCMSPALVGLSSSTGFSSVADEMNAMEEQLMKRVISPKQDFVLDSIAEIFDFFGLQFDMYLRPLTEIEGAKEEKKKVDEIHEEIKLTSECNCQKKKSDLDLLDTYAEDEPEGYVLDSIDYDINRVLNFAATSNSEQDTKLWKIRYSYNIGTSKNPIGKSRSFCNKMMSLSNSGKVFRKEDIEKMETDGINSQFGKGQKPYSIWLYGGGVNCYHRWERRIYKKKRNDEGKPLGGNPMQNVLPVNVNEAKRQGFKPKKNAKDVAIAEIDKPNKGSLK